MTRQNSGAVSVDVRMPSVSRAATWVSTVHTLRRGLSANGVFTRRSTARLLRGPSTSKSRRKLKKWLWFTATVCGATNRP